MMVQPSLMQIRKRQCVSRWKPKLRKSKLPQLKQKSNASVPNRKPAERRRRRPIADEKKRSSNVFRKKRPSANERRKLKLQRCVKDKSSRRAWMSSSATSN